MSQDGDLQYAAANPLGGRLSVTSARSISIDSTTITTNSEFIHYVPHRADPQVYFWSRAGSWSPRPLPGVISFRLADVPANSVLDIFLYFSTAGFLPLPSLRPVAWTNDTARARPLIIHRGRPALAMAVSDGRNLPMPYVGTIAITSSAGRTIDQAGNRLVWNAFNQQEYTDRGVDNGPIWNMQGPDNIWVPMHDTIIYPWRHHFVKGFNDPVNISVEFTGVDDGANFAIAMDSVTSLDNLQTGIGTWPANRGATSNNPLIGRHYVQGVGRRPVGGTQRISTGTMTVVGRR